MLANTAIRRQAPCQGLYIQFSAQGRPHREEGTSVLGPPGPSELLRFPRSRFHTQPFYSPFLGGEEASWGKFTEYDGEVIRI